ncbi:MAG TPA: hypothetical protein VGX16_03340, partial [Solirubrobacteraceae bacterium]|nr:hypothetical protein [Solirubrobacteraceae bacterium]
KKGPATNNGTEEVSLKAAYEGTKATSGVVIEFKGECSSLGVKNTKEGKWKTEILSKGEKLA